MLLFCDQLHFCGHSWNEENDTQISEKSLQLEGKTKI